MFNPEQIKDLLKNKNVKRCSPTSIAYNNDFKVRAVKQYYEDGCSPNIIFKEAGFDIDIVGRDKPAWCLSRWRRKYNNKGEPGIIEDNRGSNGGRKAKMKYKSDSEKIKYLETKIKYLDAENDFLAKLRGLKRE